MTALLWCLLVWSLSHALHTAYRLFIERRHASLSLIRCGFGLWAGWPLVR